VSEVPATKESNLQRQVDVFRGVHCSHGVHAIAAVQSLASRLRIAVHVNDIVIHDDEQARALGCLGSPTVLVSGLDVEPAARGRTSFGVT
jgi:hypothetical protein